MRLLHTLPILSLLALIALSSTPAHAQHPHDYIRVSLSGIETDGNTQTFASSTVETEYNTGVGFNFALGRDFGANDTGGLRIEVEGGYGTTSVSDATVNGISQTGEEGEITNFSLFLNGLVYVLPYSRIQPYFGGGVGVINTEYRDFGTQLNPLILDDNDSLFALQAIVGADIMITHTLDFVIDYKHRFAEDAELTNTNGQTNTIEYSTQVLSAGLKVRF